MEAFLGVLVAVVIVALGGICFWIYAIGSRRGERQDFTEFLKFDYAHRGLHGDKVPENSMLAFENAVDRGFGIELDLQLSSDGHVVVHHDDNLKRICGVDKDISSTELRELLPIRLMDTELGIPLFADVLKLVDGKTPLIVELKGAGNRMALCEKTWELLDNYKGLYCIESFDPYIVEWFREKHPKVIRGQLMANFRKGDNGLGGFAAFLARNLFTNIMTKPDFEAYDYKSRNNLSLKMAKKIYGMQEVSWTVKDAETYKKLKAEGCICIFEGFDPNKV